MGPTGGPAAVTSRYQRHAREAQLSPLVPMRMSSQADRPVCPRRAPVLPTPAVASRGQPARVQPRTALTSATVSHGTRS